jgi:1-aminocyclopropane-1-carboxylate deaminase/D-cysteine desulfhydrase-like pyridoxal-dependent ACC family enzyme
VKAPDRFPLAVLPTPLVPAPRLSAALDREIWVKRDDLTGFAFGGHKVRPLEVLVADALAQGADHLVGTGGPGSNLCTALAAAAAVAGLACTVVLYGAPPADPHPNLAVMRAFGADVVFTRDPDRAATPRHAAEVAARLAAAGHRPYVLPRGGATGLGAAAYALAAEELAEQLAFPPENVVVPVGSGGTVAGLVAGWVACGLPGRIVGVAVSRPLAETRTEVERLAAEAVGLLGLEPVALGPLRLVDRLGDGFGVTDSGVRDAARLAYRTEGLVADATYVARAVEVLASLEPPIVLWHTGGTLGFVAEAMGIEHG